MENETNTTYEAMTPQSAQQAFEAIHADLDGVANEDLVPIDVDITRACVTALGAADRLETIGDQIVRLTGFDRRALDKLRVYGLAAVYANAVATDDAGENLVALLLAEASPLRRDLLVAAEALAHRGLLPASRVEEIRAGQGRLDTADDLIALAALFDQAWAKVEHETAVTREDVDRAAILGSDLHFALGARSVPAGGRAKTEDSHLARDRAFTLLVRAYDECRRAVGYLRWHERDADRYAPSIYAKPKRRTARTEAPSTDLPIAVVEPIVPEEPTLTIV